MEEPWDLKIINMLAHMAPKKALVSCIAATCAFARMAGFTPEQLADVMTHAMENMPPALKERYAPVTDKKSQ